MEEGRCGPTRLVGLPMAIGPDSGIPVVPDHPTSHCHQIQLIHRVCLRHLSPPFAKRGISLLHGADCRYLSHSLGMLTGDERVKGVLTNPVAAWAQLSSVTLLRKSSFFFGSKFQQALQMKFFTFGGRERDHSLFHSMFAGSIVAGLLGGWVNR